MNINSAIQLFVFVFVFILHRNEIFNWMHLQYAILFRYDDVWWTWLINFISKSKQCDLSSNIVDESWMKILSHFDLESDTAFGSNSKSRTLLLTDYNNNNEHRLRLGYEVRMPIFRDLFEVQRIIMHRRNGEKELLATRLEYASMT